MLIKLLNNTGHDATNWSYTSITAHHYTSASVSSISFISFISMRIPPSTSSRLRLYNISFKWIFSNIESRIIPSKRSILLYESNQHLFPRACITKIIKWAIQYLSILIGVAWCPTRFHWLNFFSLNGDSKTIPRPNIFHRGFSSQVKWIKKIDQK